MALSPKQRRFVIEYLKDQNGKQAAIRAGYSKRTATMQASRLLTKANVRHAIDEKTQKIADKTIADRVERQRFWTAAMRDPGVEYQHRIRCSELMGKSEADFTDRVEHSGTLSLEQLLGESRA